MNVDAITERMLAAYGFTRQRQLTAQLDIAHTAIASWRRRKTVPKSALFQCVAQTGYSMAFLLTGQGVPKAKMTQNEFRFVFERYVNNAILNGVLKAGDAWSNKNMLALSDKIYQSLMNEDVFETLFEPEAKESQ